MPAPVRVRANFLGDIAYMRRLQRAIEIDKSRPAAFRKSVCRQLQSLLLTFEEQKLREDKAALAQDAGGSAG